MGTDTYEIKMVYQSVYVMIQTCQSGVDRKTEMGVFHKVIFLGSDTQHHFMARTIHSN